LGVHYLRQERYEDALDEFLKALKLIPDDPDTIYNIALIYRYYLLDYDKAKLYFKKYLEVNPNAPDRESVEQMLKELP
jgi:tetratricopeptide (TPR) repeat protein